MAKRSLDSIDHELPLTGVLLGLAAALSVTMVALLLLLVVDVP
jgi:hypothetical protein